MCKKEKGITIIALIITIIVLLIIAGISVGALTSNNSVIKRANNAKETTEEAGIKEVLKESYVVTAGKNRRAIVTEEALQEEINKTYPEAEVAKEENKFIVLLNEKYYELDDDDGEIVGPKKFEKVDKNPGDITKDKDGNPLDGTTNPYEIWNIEDFVEFSRLVSITVGTNAVSDKPFGNKKVFIMRDLDFNSIFSYDNYKAKYSYNAENNAYEPDENSTTTIKELCTSNMGFIPIGETYDRLKKCFWGNFDGNNHTIKNLYIKTDKSAGLFGATGSASIKNITLEGTIISTGSNHLASINAIGHGSTFENCHNRAKIINEGSGIASGIFGIGSGITVKNCTNEGEIISVNDSAFGISGTSGTIRLCKNTGNITGKNSASGISGAGWGNGGRTIINCGNEGEITSLNGSAAGITGGGSSSKIYNCYNSGNVNAGTIGRSGGGVLGLTRNRTF